MPFVVMVVVMMQIGMVVRVVMSSLPSTTTTLHWFSIAGASMFRTSRSRSACS
jgi:hypothetical protein